MLESEIVFDINKMGQTRGYYVCDNDLCISKIDKWKKKKLRKINAKKRK